MADRDQEFDAFVTASGPRLLRAAQLLTGDRHRAEDLLQDVLARTYVRWSRLDGAPEAYVRRGLLNGQRSWWRSRASRDVITDAVPERPVAADLSTDAVMQDAVLRALAELTRRERSVVVLRFWLDLSEAATAAELGIAPGTVKSTSSRALTRLRSSPHLSRTDPAILPLSRSTR